MALVDDLITGPAGRLGAAAQNALEVARFGGLETDEQPSPFEVVSTRPVYRLRRYYAPARDSDGKGRGRGKRKPQERPPLLLIPPMMLDADIYDVAPSTSAVSILHERGVDPWVVDFGAPEREEGGLERSLNDHVLAIDEAIDRVRAETGRDKVHIGGYSQGGMFCYQVASYRRSEGIDSIVVFGSPVDTRGTLSFGLPEETAIAAAAFLAEHVFANSGVPAWLSRTGFRLMDPAKSFRQRLQFVRQLHDREALLPKERQRRFLEAEGWVAWPGPALADVIRQFGVHNRLVSGGFVIEDRLVTLADMTCPILAFVGETDEIAPARSVRAARWAAPRSDVYEVSLRAGHFGLVVGSNAVETTWPTVADWLAWRDDKGKLPDNVVRIEDEIERPESGLGTMDRIGAGAQLAVGAGIGAARGLAGAAFGASRTLREIAGETAGQLEQLNRLGRVGARTRISMGLLMDEQAERAPDDVVLLFEDRAHTQGAVKERVDNVVRGLLEIGVRQGEHVGVLMQTRPSALTVVAALSRLGAVAVLMRPDGDPQREAELGRAGRIISDPQNAEAARDATGVQVYVLGGGGKDRTLARGLIDMERIDPDAVHVPAWYVPNPGLAGDLAFILFTGTGDRTLANRITNRRWALSAFGTASSASLGSSDTIYSAQPAYHPSALLMSVGGAIAGGSRLAVASEWDPEIFWDEVRRYGATVVSYTWAMLDEIAEAPPHPGEQHHPVRLFMGSGMPAGLWRRVSRRFAPARVLEFYASTEGDAVLVNIPGTKPGCKGRPLPGSAEVRIARWDPVNRRLVEGDDGFAVACPKHETGMLLARVRRDQIGSGDGFLRGVFEPADAWLETGDLFRRDIDGDFWLVDHVPSLIRTAGGVVASGPIQDALGTLDAVALAVAYGVRTNDGSSSIPCAAVTLRDGYELAPADLEAALVDLGDDGIPWVIRVVEEIPLTTWYRPMTAPLRTEGLKVGGKATPAWYWDPKKGGYRTLSKAAVERLLAGKA
ncbi:MAG: alpha/beta fold hydrolase [Thermoleophilales bacterium]|nr:alpha/beta fold hydrolase [Thermoleophilales bacterium]